MAHVLHSHVKMGKYSYAGTVGNLSFEEKTHTYSHYLALWAVEEKRMVFCGRYMLVFIASDEIPLIFSKYEFKTAMTAQRFIDSVHSARYSR